MKVAVAAAAAGVALAVAWRRWRARPLPTAIGALELSEFQLLPTSAQQPKRIAIVGVAGVGKSWLAEACTARLGIPRLELDRMLEHRWREGAARKDGSGSDLTDMRKALKKNAGWVADGNFRAAVLEVWPRAELIVVLDLPMPLRVWRVCRREWQRERADRYKYASRYAAFKGMLWLLAQAAGLGPQREVLTSYLVELQARHAESAEQLERKRAEQVAKGQTPKAAVARRAVPVLVLRGNVQVREWLDLVSSQSTHPQ